ncbi:MAG: hypothetical protein GYB31_01615 [Bacteroidetes bacterium]|nr:hypothetical protein [Bacteroidota bacterium]
MRKYLLTQLFLLFGFMALGQGLQSLTDYNQSRLKKQQTAMTILGTWAVGNMATGAILVGGSEGPDKYFHQMNIGWNAVNLTLAGFGLYGALTTDPGSFDLYQTIEQQHRFQKILLFNAGLDVGYMAGGAWMIERSKRETGEKADRFLGFGRSIVLQGAFLFVFDLTAAIVLSADNPEIQDLLSKLRFHGNGFSLCLQFG